MKNWNNKTVICINEKTGKEVKVGDKVTCFRGSEYTIRSFEPPHKPSSTGRIYTHEGLGGKYASVYGCKYVEVE